MSLPFWFFQIFHNKNVTYVLQFSSVAQSCPNLCNPMNCSMPGLPVHHQRENTMIISFRTQPISKSTDFFISQIEKPSFQILQHQLCQRDTHLCELVNNLFLIKILYLHLSNTFRMGGGMTCEPPYTWTHARVHTHTHTHTESYWEMWTILVLPWVAQFDSYDFSNPLWKYDLWGPGKPGSAHSHLIIHVPCM